MQPEIASTEQRKHRRFTFYRPVEYSPGTICEAGPWSNGKAVDLSFGGIRIISECRLHEDDLVHIRLDSESAAAGFVTCARIVYVQPDDGGQWQCGCEFVPQPAQRPDNSCAVSFDGIDE